MKTDLDVSLIDGSSAEACESASKVFGADKGSNGRAETQSTGWRTVAALGDV
jgi:hypothetical protein